MSSRHPVECSVRCILQYICTHVQCLPVARNVHAALLDEHTWTECRNIPTPIMHPNARKYWQATFHIQQLSVAHVRHQCLQRTCHDRKQGTCVFLFWIAHTLSFYTYTHIYSIELVHSLQLLPCAKICYVNISKHSRNSIAATYTVRQTPFAPFP